MPMYTNHPLAIDYGGNRTRPITPPSNMTVAFSSREQWTRATNAAPRSFGRTHVRDTASAISLRESKP